MVAWDSLGGRGRLTVGEVRFGIHRLGRIDGADQLPYSLKVMLENLLRSEDGRLVTAEQFEALAHWQPRAEHGPQIAFTPARVLMQDFTGVPCVVDLVAMRDAITTLGGDAARIPVPGRRVGRVAGAVRRGGLPDHRLRHLLAGDQDTTGARR